MSYWSGKPQIRPVKRIIMTFFSTSYHGGVERAAGFDLTGDRGGTGWRRSECPRSHADVYTFMSTKLMLPRHPHRPIVRWHCQLLVLWSEHANRSFQILDLIFLAYPLLIDPTWTDTQEPFSLHGIISREFIKILCLPFISKTQHDLQLDWVRGICFLAGWFSKQSNVGGAYH